MKGGKLSHQTERLGSHPEPKRCAKSSLTEPVEQLNCHQKLEATRKKEAERDQL